jgi:polyferredoxin
MKMFLRSPRQWLAAIVPAVLIGGFFTPYLGLVVPLVMTGGLATAALGRGRRFCGHYCPRGAFLGEWLGWIPKGYLPASMRTRVRWVLLPLLLGFMTWQLWAGPPTLAHAGRVFWTMCLVTTGMALILAIAFRRRAWCAVCPIGALSSVIRPPAPFFTPPPKCRDCKLCDRACPLALLPSTGLAGSAGDCLQCSGCAAACPLSRPKAADARAAA